MGGSHCAEKCHEDEEVDDAMMIYQQVQTGTMGGLVLGEGRVEVVEEGAVEEKTGREAYQRGKR